MSSEASTIVEQLGRGEPVLWTTKGVSMQPSIVTGRNYVGIQPATAETARLYDVVLAIAGKRRMRLHRLIRRKGDLCYTRGDNCLRGEWVKAESIVGVLSHIYTIGTDRKRETLNWRYRLEGRALGWALPIRHLISFPRRVARWLRSDFRLPEPIFPDEFWPVLRAGLWGDPSQVVDLPTLGDEQWIAIYEAAKYSQLDGIVYDGWLQLHGDRQPPRSVADKAFVKAAALVGLHHSHQALIKEIVEELDRVGIAALLLKGESLSQYYPDYLRRNCGDIDIYVGRDNYERAVRHMLGLGGKLLEHDIPNPKHTELMYKGVMVEVHCYASNLVNEAPNHEVRAFELKHLEQEYEVLTLQNGLRVRVPGITYNAFFIFAHAYVHLIHGEPVLRQFADLARLLHCRHRDIDQSELMQLLTRLGVLSEWQTTGCFLSKCLGLAEECVPFYSNESEGRIEGLVRLFDKYTATEARLPLPRKGSGLQTLRWGISKLYRKCRYASELKRVFPYSARKHVTIRTSKSIVKYLRLIFFRHR